jgi:hypothetical protein
MFLNIVDESLYGDEVFAMDTAIGGHEDKNLNLLFSNRLF